MSGLPSRQGERGTDAGRESVDATSEILRLKYEFGTSDRAIAVAIGIARSTVRLCLDRVAAAGLIWPLPATLTDASLETLLLVDRFPVASAE